MGAKRTTVGSALAACALAGLLATSAACGGKDEPSISQTGGTSGSESVGGRDGGSGEPDAGRETDAASQPDIDASVPTTCDMQCAPGERCELVQVTCIRAPCPPLPSCVKAEPVSCDPRQILCRRAPPECPEWQVPSVSGNCFGPCVPLEQCACDEPADCPEPNRYTCHRAPAHCGPYVE